MGSTDLSLGMAFVKLGLILGSFLGGVAIYRLANDAFTHHIAKQEWYPYSTGYLDPKTFGPSKKRPIT